MVNISRRKFIQASAISYLSISSTNFVNRAFASNIKYQGLIPKKTTTIETYPGYEYQLLVSFGENLFSDNNYDFYNPSLSVIRQCYGYNNDYVAFMPFEGEDNKGLLCVNHEYTQPELIFPPEFLRNNKIKALEIAFETMGHSIFEVEKISGKWRINKNSIYNRRITPTNNLCEIKGYARGASRLKTKHDVSGEFVYGSFANCAGGKTPWGTILIAEENINMMFGGENKNARESASLKAYNFKNKSKYGFEKIHKRLDITDNNGEYNKFGYLVEIDPFNPEKPPVKRTSLGRFFHEGAAVKIAKSGHVVVYSTDDKNFEHLYKFVSKDKYDSVNFNPDILDEGILYVAKFYENGELEWLPLIFGQNGLTKENGFEDKADIYIDTRIAAKNVGATALDRPEGIVISPESNKIYISLTNNFKKFNGDIFKDNFPNIYGYILEIDPINDHDADIMSWDIALDASNYQEPDNVIANPDNLTFDKKGNLWIATDGMEKTRNISDSIYKFDLKNNSLTRYLNTPIGSEVCGPEFSPDNQSLFLAIQHPASGSSFAKPSTRWPRFTENIPPLPSLIVLSKS